MLAKKNRLKKKKDFETTFQRGEGFKQDFLFLKILKNSLKFSRFGFVVSKKISKKATVRNKIRRRLSEIIKANLPKIEKAWDGIIIVDCGIKDKNFREVEATIEKLFKRAGLISN